jgi:hypothetical protein
MQWIQLSAFIGLTVSEEVFSEIVALPIQWTCANLPIFSFSDCRSRFIVRWKGPVRILITREMVNIIRRFLQTITGYVVVESSRSSQCGVIVTIREYESK